MAECGVIEDEYVGEGGANEVDSQAKEPASWNDYHVQRVDGSLDIGAYHVIKYRDNP